MVSSQIKIVGKRLFVLSTRPKEKVYPISPHLQSECRYRSQGPFQTCKSVRAHMAYQVGGRGGDESGEEAT